MKKTIIYNKPRDVDKANTWSSDTYKSNKNGKLRSTKI